MLKIQKGKHGIVDGIYLTAKDFDKLRLTLRKSRGGRKGIIFGEIEATKWLNLNNPR